MTKSIDQNPEILFILSVLFYWVSTSILLNPVAISLFILGLVMMLKRFKSLAVAVGVMYLIINAYMILALMSEFTEFPAINWDALVMLGVGGAFIAVNIYIGLRLMINNIPSVSKEEQLV
ncbi:MAG: hypothetical protein ACJA1A_002152 [Saprospiraceae bacterium]|jgi:hypothetical protein